MLKALIPVSVLTVVATTARAQYLETFSTPTKGYLLNLVDDFTGVDWTLSAWSQVFPERDVSDYFQTTAAGVLECIDLDQEVCWRSPTLTATATGNASFTTDITWTGFDVNQVNPLEFVNVEYRINAGAWVRHPNVIGANGDPAYTVRYTSGTGPFGGSATTIFPSIPVNFGDSFDVRICVSDNANAEVVTIDNVSVSGVSALVCSTSASVSSIGASTGLVANFGPATLSSAAPILGTTPSLALTYANPNTEPGALLISLGTGLTPFGGIELYVDLGPTLAAVAISSTAGTSIPVAIPSSPVFCTGVPVYFQMVVRDLSTDGAPASSLPLVATNGLRWVIGM